MERKEPLHRGLAPFIVWYPLLMVAVTMGLFLWVWDPKAGNVFEAQTVAFLTIAFFEMYQAFASRSTRYPALKVGLFKNRWLVLAVAASFSVIFTLLYLPVTIPYAGLTLQELDLGLLTFIILVSSVGFIYLELRKWLNTRWEDVVS